MQYLRIHIPMQLYRSIQIVLGFMLLMLTGALLLMLPAAQTGESEIHFMDALFTSVSAVSVTGMSMIDIQSDLSWIGQLIIICLVQTGALGIMTIAGILGNYERTPYRSAAETDDSGIFQYADAVRHGGSCTENCMVYPLYRISVRNSNGSQSLFYLWIQRNISGILGSGVIILQFRI